MAKEKQTKTESTKKKLQGKVVAKKMQNTITVRVESKFAHPLYGKIIKSHKKYLVHCEDESIEIGDKVTIEEGKPMSKRKTFYFVEKLEN